MPKHTPEQKRAKQALANAKSKVRDLMIKGKVEEATQLAEKNGFKLFDARLAPEYQSPAEPAYKALEEQQKAAEELASRVTITGYIIPEECLTEEGKRVLAEANAETHREGWPLKCEAVVYRTVPNPKLVVVQLKALDAEGKPDNRIVSMLRGRFCTYRIHKRIHTKLVSTEPEALYDHDFQRS